MTMAMQRLTLSKPIPAFPVTIYYAFKQSENDRGFSGDQHRLGDVLWMP